MLRTLPHKHILIAAFLALLVVPATAQAQHRRAVARHSTVFVGGYFYDPFYGAYPWWPSSAYPYAYYPAYYDSRAGLRVIATPKEASVYVDGFYSGVVDDFDGLFQRLPVTPGGHEVVLYLPGYRTVHQSVYVRPGSTFKLSLTMEKLAAGDTSEPPPAAPPVPEPPAGSATRPRSAPPRGIRPVPPETAPSGSQDGTFGSVVIRVQPGDADVTIDGERWQASGPGERLVVQLSEGSHRVVVEKNGFRTYSAEINVRRGQTTPLNVSLSPE
jgi:hypothetical protein